MQKRPCRAQACWSATCATDLRAMWTGAPASVQAAPTIFALWVSAGPCAVDPEQCFLLVVACADGWGRASFSMPTGLCHGAAPRVPPTVSFVFSSLGSLDRTARPMAHCSSLCFLCHNLALFGALSHLASSHTAHVYLIAYRVRHSNPLLCFSPIFPLSPSPIAVCCCL